MVSRESGARTLCLQCQSTSCWLQVAISLMFLGAFGQFAQRATEDGEDHLHDLCLWLLRHFQNVWSDWGRQTIETTCNLWPESFSWSSYVVAFSLWHGFRFKHSRFWRSKFRWNRVSIRAPITLLAVDLVLQIRSHFHFFFLRFFMLYNACCMPGAKLEPRKRGLQ